MKMKTKLILLAPLLLAGCFAKYTYVHTTAPDGTVTCSVSITSGREIDVGSLSIGKDCDTIGGAEGMTNDTFTEVIKAIVE